MTLECNDKSRWSKKTCCVSSSVSNLFRFRRRATLGHSQMQALLSLSSIASKTLSQESLDLDAELPRSGRTQSGQISQQQQSSTASMHAGTQSVPPPPPPTPVNAFLVPSSPSLANVTSQDQDDDDLYEDPSSSRQRRRKRQRSSSSASTLQHESSIEDLKKELKTKQTTIERLQKEVNQFKELAQQKSGELEGLCGVGKTMEN